MAEESTASIYNKAAGRWVRNEAQSLSDFTGRPPVFELCGDVRGKDIVDLGCGEGYCARILMENGAASLHGIDISQKMIEAAQAVAGEDTRYHYQTGTVTDLPFEANRFDLALGVFVFNYLDIAQSLQTMKEAWRVLKPGGLFVFSVPHPAFPLARREHEKPFYFDFGDKGYFTARNHRTFGRIFRRDGQELPVEMNHKLVEDYMECLREAGFTTIPTVRELGVTPEHLEIDPEFFSPVQDMPLHMAFRTQKPV